MATYNVTITESGGSVSVTPKVLTIATGPGTIVWALSGSVAWQGTGIQVGTSKGAGATFGGTASASGANYAVTYNSTPTPPFTFPYTINTNPSYNLAARFRGVGGGDPPVIQNDGSGTPMPHPKRFDPDKD